MQIKWPILVLFLFISGIVFYAFYSRIENFLVFFPASVHDSTPESFGLSYQNVFFETGDGKRLHGWFFPLPGDSPVILFCHGNAGNISHRLENVRLLVARGFQVFIFDYRGYGKSTGKPSEAGIYKDGLGAYDDLVKRAGISPSRIIVFGRSLGAAVALEVALKRKVRSLVMESAFTSTKGMAKTMFLFNVLSPLLPAHYDNLTKISRLDLPKLFVHGREDEIVPFFMGRELFAAAKTPKFFYILDGAGHNDTYLVGGTSYFDALELFARTGSMAMQDNSF
jgi:fermentation-respiration switch protein FrsA (DUF1100 family)